MEKLGENGRHHQILREKLLYINLFSCLYDRKWPNILLFFILKFGSVFVSAVRFCGVSAGVSAAFLRRILPGSLRVLANWAVLFLRRFCRVSAGPFFGLGSIERAAKRMDAKSHIGGNSFLPQILAKQISI